MAEIDSHPIDEVDRMGYISTTSLVEEQVFLYHHLAD
jgi:hypothetical protein